MTYHSSVSLAMAWKRLQTWLTRHKSCSNK